MLHIGAADPATHKIYIWDISNDGQFASALDGGREPLIDVHVSCPLLTIYPYSLCLSRSGTHLLHALPQLPTKALFSSGIAPLLNDGVHSQEDSKKRMRMFRMKKESQSSI